MKVPYTAEWYLMEREDYAHYLFVVDTWEKFTTLPARWGFQGPRYVAAEYADSACKLYVAKKKFDQANKHNFRLLFTKPQWWDRLHRLNIQYSHKIKAYGRSVKKMPVRKLSNRKLASIMERFYPLQASVHVTRGPMWMLETPDNLVSEYLHSYLADRAREIGSVKHPPQEAFRILSIPRRKSHWTREKEGLARIALIRGAAARDKALRSHARRYAWLEYGLQGSLLDYDYFKKELQKMRRKGGRSVLTEFQAETRHIAQQQKAVTKEYRIGSTHRKIFKIVRDSLFTRLYSKDAQFYSYYCLEPVQRELGRRAGLSLEQMRFLAPGEYGRILDSNQDYNEITNQRQRYSLHFSNHGQTVFFLGDRARKARKKMKLYKEKKRPVQTETLHGQPAFHGTVRGNVKIVNTIPEMAKMHAGNVLVSHMTNPGIVPAMKKAAAIVTDLGGITCHAAIVARELKRPCVIGTKDATTVFKDGDRVEVDATQGVVKKI